MATRTTAIQGNPTGRLRRRPPNIGAVIAVVSLIARAGPPLIVFVCAAAFVVALTGTGPVGGMLLVPFAVGYATFPSRRRVGVRARPLGLVLAAEVTFLSALYAPALQPALPT